MCFDNVVALLNEECVTVKCRLTGRIEDTSQDAPTFTFRCSKELADSLKKDDLVVVERKRSGNDHLGFARVHEIDDFVDIMPDSEIQYLWIIQKVDLDPVSVIKEKEKRIFQRLQKEQRRRVVQEAVQSLGISLDLLK